MKRKQTKVEYAIVMIKNKKCTLAGHMRRIEKQMNSQQSGNPCLNSRSKGRQKYTGVHLPQKQE